MSCHKRVVPEKFAPENYNRARKFMSFRNVEVVPVSPQIWTPRGFGPLPSPNSLADMDPTSQIWTPLPNFPFKHPLYHIWLLILIQHSSIKVKKKSQPFSSNSTAFIIASRTVYAKIRCEKTTAFELLKLSQ